jgi:hypothetical protein
VIQSTIDYFSELMAANDPAEVETSMLTCQEKINGYRTEQTFLKVHTSVIAMLREPSHNTLHH